MSKVIEVNERICVSFGTAPSEPDFITIEDERGYVLVDISDWENVKRAIDRLIADKKDADFENMTDEQKQTRKDNALAWIDSLNKDG